MQTFLPYPSFARSAKCLDRQRLGKQRIEVLQILRTLMGESTGWANHPAVNAWRGHEGSLSQFGEHCCIEWRSRGYKDTIEDKIVGLVEPTTKLTTMQWCIPMWMTNERVFSAYRALLLHKDPAHYGQFWWTEEPSDNRPWGLMA